MRGPPRRVPPQGGQGHFLQSRSSKVSEKLVLIPETEEEETRRWDYQDEDEDGPLRDDEEGDDHFPEEAGPLPTRKSYAERLPKYRRAEKFSRVTAYCIADGFRLKNVSKFLKETHGAKTKLYDECLYAAYHLPLLGGGGGYRIKSSPALKSPGGKPVLDVEIERSEQRNYHEGYFDNDYEDRRESVDDGDVGSADLKSPHPDDLASQGAHFSGDGGETEGGFPGFQNFDAFGHGETDPQGHIDDRHEQHDRPDTALQSETRALDNQSVIDMKGIAEVFIFSYGVVVLWNFSERQEKDILADLTFSRDKELPLVVNQWSEKDFENEEFHFQYSQRARSPRVSPLISFLYPVSLYQMRGMAIEFIADSSTIDLQRHDNPLLRRHPNKTLHLPRHRPIHQTLFLRRTHERDHVWSGAHPETTRLNWRTRHGSSRGDQDDRSALPLTCQRQPVLQRLRHTRIFLGRARLETDL